MWREAFIFLRVSTAADLPDEVEALKAALLAARATIAVKEFELGAARADALAAQTALEAGAVEIEHLKALIVQMRAKHSRKIPAHLSQGRHGKSAELLPRALAGAVALLQRRTPRHRQQCR